MDGISIKAAALEPLYAAWEEPLKHRVRGPAGAETREGRRASSIIIAQQLRGTVKEWRDNYYPGASDTSRHLLNHWFGRAPPMCASPTAPRRSWDCWSASIRR